MKKFFVLLFMFSTLTAFAQTVNIPISTNIQTINGKTFYIHTVQKGQTVYSISRAYHVSIADLYKYNPHAKNGIQIGQKLYIPDFNQPAATATKTQNTSNNQDGLKSFDYFYHVASAGETIAHVSSIYLVPEKYIYLANPGLKGPLKEGQYIKIPVEDAYKILDAQANGAKVNPKSTVLPAVEHIKVPAPPKPTPKKTTFVLPNSSTNSTPKKKHQVQEPAPFIKNYQHVVIPGETMQSIAQKYGITVAQLKSVNPGLVMVMQGQKLKLPINAKIPGYKPENINQPTEKPTIKHQNKKIRNKNKKPVIQDVNSTQYIKHTVSKGETLYSISKRYGVNLADLYQANKNLTTNIKIGQQILIPKKKMNEPYVLYSPSKKIRLKKVARLYKIKFDLLKNKNPEIGRKVYPGEVVRVPVEQYIVQQQPTFPEKEKEKEKETETITPATVQQNTQQVSTIACTPNVHPGEFKVALMVPLYLNDMDSLDIAQFMLQNNKKFAPFSFLKFLQGGLLATNLMKQQGMNVQLYVYDVDQHLSKADEVLLHPELKDMNLIIGPFYSRPFAEIASFAAQNNIPIINPLTLRNEVLFKNHGVIKVQPGFQYQLHPVKKYIAEHQVFDKVFVVHQGDENGNPMILNLIDSIATVLPKEVKFSNADLVHLGIQVTQREKEKARQNFLKLMAADPNHEIYPADTVLPPVTTTITDTLQPYTFENTTIYPDSLKLFSTDSTVFPNPIISINYSVDSLHPFENNASVLRKNLVIIYGTSKAFSMDVMNRLNVQRDTFNIRLIGMPDWENFTEMDYNQMNNLKLVYPASYYVDYSAMKTKEVDSLFVNQFGTLPEKLGNMGFDITYYFLNALYYMGNQFTNCLPYYPYNGISSQYRFKPAGNEGNYENSFWFMLQINNMRLYDLSNPGFIFRPSPLRPENDTVQ